MKPTPITIHNLTKVMIAQARELDKEVDRRNEDFEDANAAWALREAAKRLRALESKCIRLELKKR